MVSAIISFLRALVFQVIFMLLLPALFGVNGIWWAMFAADSAPLHYRFSFLPLNARNTVTYEIYLSIS